MLFLAVNRGYVNLSISRIKKQIKQINVYSQDWPWYSLRGPVGFGCFWGEWSTDPSWVVLELDHNMSDPLEKNRCRVLQWCPIGKSWFNIFNQQKWWFHGIDSWHLIAKLVYNSNYYLATPCRRAEFDHVVSVSGTAGRKNYDLWWYYSYLPSGKLTQP